MICTPRASIAEAKAWRSECGVNPSAIPATSAACVNRKRIVPYCWNSLPFPGMSGPSGMSRTISHSQEGTGTSRYSPALRCLSGSRLLPSLDACHATRKTVPSSMKSSLDHRERLFDAKPAATHEPDAQSRAGHGALGLRVDTAVRDDPDLLVRREDEVLTGVPAVVGKLDAVQPVTAELARLHGLVQRGHDDVPRLLARCVAQVLHLDREQVHHPVTVVRHLRRASCRRTRA